MKQKRHSTEKEYPYPARSMVTTRSVHFAASTTSTLRRDPTSMARKV